MATDPDYSVVVSYEARWDENIGYYTYDFPLDALEPPKTEHKDYEGNILSELRPVAD